MADHIGPAAFGVFQPTIVMPEVLLRGRSLEQVEPVLAHELVHSRRGDPWVAILQLAATVIWWFHPLVWWASREMSRQRERCCDEEAVAGLGYPPAIYARSLLDVLESRRALRPFLAFVGIRPAEVTSKRMENIMKLHEKFSSSNAGVVLGSTGSGGSRGSPGETVAHSRRCARAARAKKEKPSHANVSVLSSATLPAPPLTYNAVSDTKVYPKPPLPKMGPAGCILKDPVFGCPIVRVSDEQTFNGDPIHTPAGGVQDTFNLDSTLFVVQTGGGRNIPFRFDPQTLKVSRIPGLETLPGIGGDAPFSRREKDVCWGKDIRRNMIVKFNFTTQTATDVCDVSKLTGLPVVNRHLGAFSISANDCLTVTFGGAGQNRDPYLLWYDAKSNSRHVWNTEEGTIDGKAIPNAPHFTQHAAGVDFSGRYVVAVPGRGSQVPWIWDIQRGTVYPMQAQMEGHFAAGYGDMVNGDRPMMYRTLDPEGLRNPKPIMQHPAGEPYFWYDNHISWNKAARPDQHVPAPTSTYHHLERGDPKCAWGDEVSAVATDGSMKVWRFCHHRSTVHFPTRDASGGRALPTSRENMAAQQAYNFWDTPRGNVSQDGRFFMFNSNWEDTVGKDRAGRFREDVFIVKLDNEGAPAVAFPASETPTTRSSALGAAGRPTAGGPRTPVASTGKSAAGDIDVSRARQLLLKQRSGQELTPEEQAYLEQVKKARAAAGGHRPAAVQDAGGT